jgi:DNA-binding IclR family transcriptional regulator
MTSASGRIFSAFAAEGPTGRSAAARELAAIREARFATDAEQLDECIRMIAAPVFQAGKIVAALALVGTTSAVPAEPDSALATKLIASAQHLSDELGLND